jgi:hypothetical protein
MNSYVWSNADKSLLPKSINQCGGPQRSSILEEKVNLHLRKLQEANQQAQNSGKKTSHSINRNGSPLFLRLHALELK